MLDASNTDFDIDGDLGEECYVTGNGGGNAGSDDIDNGETFLRSPSMDLSNYNQPILSYFTWFFNDGGGGMSGPPNDSLIIMAPTDLVMKSSLKLLQILKARGDHNLSLFYLTL